jgi:hypothetical protein
VFLLESGRLTLPSQDLFIAKELAAQEKEQKEKQESGSQLTV